MAFPKRRKKRRKRKRKIDLDSFLQPKEEMTGAFGQALDWIGGTERVSTSLLMGEPLNALQEAGAFLTGPLRGVTSALPFVPKIGFNPPRERHSFSDVLRNYGFNVEEDSSFETGANVLGGIGVDLTTYLTGGWGGFAKKLVFRAPKKLASRSLGSSILRGVGGKMSPRMKTLEAKLRRQYPDLAPDKFSGKVGEEVFQDSLYRTKYFNDLNNVDRARLMSQLRSGDWQNLSEEVWDAVVGELWKGKHLTKSGFRLHMGLPFMRGTEIPGSREFFQKSKDIWNQTAGKLIPVGEYYDLMSKGLVSRLLNKTETTRLAVPEGMKYVARDYIQRQKRMDTNIAEKVWSLFGPEGSQTWHRIVDPDDLTFLKLDPDDLVGYRNLLNGANAEVGRSIYNTIKNENIGGFLAYANMYITDPQVWKSHNAAYQKYKILRKARVHELTPARLEETLTIPEIIYHRKIIRNKARWANKLKDFVRGQVIPSTGKIKPGTKYTWIKDKAEFDELIHYAADVFKDFPVNKIWIEKLVSGGKLGPFKLKDESLIGTLPTYRKGKGLEKAFQFLLAPGSKWIHTKEGSYFHFPGYNPLWKQLVTTFPTNVSFHLRNAIGAIFMGALDPDIGWSGITGALRMVPGLTADGHSFRAVHRALHMDQKIAKAGYDEVMELSRKGIKLGNRDIKEFLHIAKGALGGRISHSAADVTSEIGEAFDLLSRHSTKKLSWKYYFNAGENMANYVENYMRLNGLHKLLKEGVPKVDAVFRMQKQFVDYSIVSNVDRILRDWIPFIKYQTSSIRWAKQLAMRPRQIAWIGKLQESQGVLKEEQRDPQSGETGLFLPMGKYRANLGSGAEATIGMVGSMWAPKDFAKKMITETHPIYRLALEYMIGRDVYTERPFMTDRRAPKWMPDGMVNLITRKNKVTSREIHPYARALLYKGPFSRQIRTMEQFFGLDEKYADNRAAGVLRALTMTRTVRDFKKREGRVLIRRLNHILKEKEKEGDLRRYVAWISTYDSKSTPPELKSLIRYYAKAIQDQKKRSRDKRRGAR